MKANYDLISEEWSNLRKALPPQDYLLFELFVDRMPKKARVLDLGCGNGIPIAKLLDDNGFFVTGVDRSAKLLEKARLNVPNAGFQRSEIEDFEIAGKYDGVVLWDTLFHIPREKHQRIIKNIFDSLQPNGVLILSSGGSEESLPSFTDFMFGVEFFYDSYSVKEFLRLCESIGFTVIRHELVNKPDGARDKGRIGVLLLRRE